jgi:hypothetical protein
LSHAGAQRRQLLASLCADLRLLWTQAGGPSLRSLESRLGLSKSQVGAILGGRIRRPPGWHVVCGLVDSVYEHAVTRGVVDRLSLRTGVEEYWRPRYAVLEHAFDRSRPGGRSGPQLPDAGAGTAVPMAAAPVAQLPSAVAGFAGREGALDALDAGLAAGADRLFAVRIVVIGGVAGVGKTALAVEVHSVWCW